MSEKRKNIVEESEELYTTQDLLSEEPVAAASEAELQDQEVTEGHDAYETDEEELVAESENLEKIAEDEEPTEDDQEAMEEDTEQTKTSNDLKLKPGAREKPNISTHNRISELPLSKVKHIIKLDPDVNLVNGEAVYLVTRATEFFIRTLAKEAHNHAAQQKKKTLTKSHVDQALAMLPIEL